jgi:hypothetical protein
MNVRKIKGNERRINSSLLYFMSLGAHKSISWGNRGPCISLHIHLKVKNISVKAVNLNSESHAVRGTYTTLVVRSAVLECLPICKVNLLICRRYIGLFYLKCSSTDFGVHCTY